MISLDCDFVTAHKYFLWQNELDSIMKTVTMLALGNSIDEV